MQDCLTTNSFFAQEKLLGLKQAHTNILNSADLNSDDIFREILTSMNFPNSQNLDHASEAQDDFIQKIMVAIDKVAPIKERRIKHNSQEWSDGENF